MAFYVGINDKSRKIKNIYIGVNGVARKIKQLYVGVSEIARRIFFQEIKKVSNATSLPNYSWLMESTNIGNYLLFSGGRYQGSTDDFDSSYVYAYSKSLVLSQPTKLSNARNRHGTCTIGNYALVGGGYSTSSWISDKVDTYNTSLTKSTATSMQSNRIYLGSDSNGTYALFGPGQGATTDVDAYNTSLTRSSPSDVTYVNVDGEITHVGNYFLVGPGRSTSTNSSGYYTAGDDVYAYNNSLTKSTPTIFSYSRYSYGAVLLGSRAVFFGGRNQGTFRSSMEVYTSSLTHSTVSGVSICEMGYTVIQDNLIIGGGDDRDSIAAETDKVYCYDTSLTRKILTPLSHTKHYLCGGTIGDYVLFAGGCYQGTDYKVVEVYQLS